MGSVLRVQAGKEFVVKPVRRLCLKARETVMCALDLSIDCIHTFCCFVFEEIDFPSEGVFVRRACPSKDHRVMKDRRLISFPRASRSLCVSKLTERRYRF